MFKQEAPNWETRGHLLFNYFELGSLLFVVQVSFKHEKSCSSRRCSLRTSALLWEQRSTRAPGHFKGRWRGLFVRLAEITALATFFKTVTLQGLLQSFFFKRKKYINGNLKSRCVLRCRTESFQSNKQLLIFMYPWCISFR